MILVRYFAGARAAAGVPEERVPAAPTLDDLIAGLGGRNTGHVHRVLPSCTFLVNGLVRHDHTAPLEPDAVVDVLPPFAGG